MPILPITIPQERNAYKIQKSRMLLQDYNTAPNPRNFKDDRTALIAEQRLMKDTMPEEYEHYKMIFNNKRAIKYYRKKYGQEGVTKVVEKYTKSAPFLRKLLAQRLLSGSFADETMLLLKDMLKNRVIK
ncbi:hypothetical protein J6E39_00555 [bacterium]|nr:hypothetical protein [bacterium]